MRKLALTLTATALALGMMALTANAQTQQPGSFHAQIQNATPIVTQAACRGWGPYCRPGFVRACAPFRGCWCRPCW
jgi:hypothetical protein